MDTNTDTQPTKVAADYNPIAALIQAQKQLDAPTPPEPEFKNEQARKIHETKMVEKYLYLLASGDTRNIQAQLDAKLAKVEKALDSASDPLKKLALAQDRINIKRQIRNNTSAAIFDECEREFIKHARSYSERKEITYMAWRAVGVTAEVLRKAGVPRNRVD